jgi:hypothetical protein
VSKVLRCSCRPCRWYTSVTGVVARMHGGLILVTPIGLTELTLSGCSLSLLLTVRLDSDDRVFPENVTRSSLKSSGSVSLG